MNARAGRPRGTAESSATTRRPAGQPARHVRTSVRAVHAQSPSHARAHTHTACVRATRPHVFVSAIRSSSVWRTYDFADACSMDPPWAWYAHVDIGGAGRALHARRTSRLVYRPEHRRRGTVPDRDEGYAARPGEIHSDPIRQQRALPDRRNECTPGHGRYVHVRYERGGIGAVRRRDGRPAGGPVRAVHSAVVVPYSSWSTSMARSTRDRATAVCRRRRRTRTHYYIMVETKPMGAPAGTCSACMRVRVHWRTAARSRTYSAVGVSWRASERRSLSSRSFIVKHLGLV